MARRAVLMISLQFGEPFWLHLVMRKLAREIVTRGFLRTPCGIPVGEAGSAGLLLKARDDYRGLFLRAVARGVRALDGDVVDAVLVHRGGRLDRDAQLADDRPVRREEPASRFLYGTSLSSGLGLGAGR